MTTAASPPSKTSPTKNCLNHQNARLPVTEPLFNGGKLTLPGQDEPNRDALAGAANHIWAQHQAACCWRVEAVMKQGWIRVEPVTLQSEWFGFFCCFSPALFHRLKSSLGCWSASVCPSAKRFCVIISGRGIMGKTGGEDSGVRAD